MMVVSVSFYFPTGRNSSHFGGERRPTNETLQCIMTAHNEGSSKVGINLSPGRGNDLEMS